MHYCVQADNEDTAGQEASEALHHSLSPAERSAIVESLPADSKAASRKCMDALGGLDCEASLIAQLVCMLVPQISSCIIM